MNNKNKHWERHAGSETINKALLRDRIVRWLVIIGCVALLCFLAKVFTP